jgi:hypothetical protein
MNEFEHYFQRKRIGNVRLAHRLSQRDYYKASPDVGVYALECKGIVKIGYSLSVRYRCSGIKATDLNKQGRLIAILTRNILMEPVIQRRFKHLWVTGEWYHFKEELQELCESRICFFKDNAMNEIALDLYEAEQKSRKLTVSLCRDLQKIRNCWDKTWSLSPGYITKLAKIRKKLNL